MITRLIIVKDMINSDLVMFFSPLAGREFAAANSSS